MRRIFAFGMAVLCAFCASGPNVFAAPAPPPRDLAAICARNPCRPAVEEFRLKDSAGGTYILDTSLVPYADEGRVTLFAGETVTVAFPDSGVGMPRFLRTTDALEAGPPRSLTLQLAQGSGRSDMDLVLQSTLDTAILFDAMLYVPSPNGMGTRRIASCLVAADGPTRFTWPYPVATMVLSNFRSPAGTSSDCR